MSEHFQEEYGSPRLSEAFVCFKGFHSRGAVPQEDDFILCAIANSTFPLQSYMTDFEIQENLGLLQILSGETLLDIDNKI